jgi:hypothetical protein
VNRSAAGRNLFGFSRTLIPLAFGPRSLAARQESSSETVTKLTLGILTGWIAEDMPTYRYQSGQWRAESRAKKCVPLEAASSFGVPAGFDLMRLVSKTLNMCGRRDHSLIHLLKPRLPDLFCGLRRQTVYGKL